ncbi:hypothetical protein NUSPORA_01106 [Nucleospora cyclopteri]
MKDNDTISSTNKIKEELKPMSINSLSSNETNYSDSKRLKTEIKADSNKKEQKRNKNVINEEKNCIEEKTSKDKKEEQFIFKPSEITVGSNKNIFDQKNEEKKNQKCSQFLTRKEVKSKEIAKMEIPRNNIPVFKNAKLYYLDDDEWIDFAQGNIFLKDENFVFIRTGFAKCMLNFNFKESNFKVDEYEVFFTFDDKKFKIIFGKELPKKFVNLISKK